MAPGSQRRQAGVVAQPLRIRAVALLAALAGTSCSGSGMTSAERTWAEQTVLEVARVNDVMALEFLPAQSVTGDPNDVTTPGGPGTDWEALVSACGKLANEDLQRGPTGAPPARFETA